MIYFLFIILIIGVIKLMATFNELTAAVQANTDAINAAVAFIQANPPADPAAIQALIDQLTSADAALKAATTPTA